MKMNRPSFALGLALVAGLSCNELPASAALLRLTVRDGASGRPTPSRVHLKGPDAKPVRHPSLPFWHDHFTCAGTAEIEIPAGVFTYEVERGPEHETLSGRIDVSKQTAQDLNLELRRIANLPADGWWPGELHVHRPLEHAELLMRGEDLHVANFITWWNDRNPWRDRPVPSPSVVRFDDNRFYDLLAGEDEREGGALLYSNLGGTLPIAGATREFPSPVQFLTLAREQPGVWVDVEKPFWWDAPIWFATGQVDSVGLANNHMCRSQMLENEAWGRPRDARRLPPPRGNGFWTQEIYYQLLNSGLRLPPSAGSASGVLPNPVGYNRVYVHTGPTLSWSNWWDGLRQGRCFVSNGPLLRCRANGELPGHTFTLPAGGELSVELTYALSAKERVPDLEVVHNGRVAQRFQWTTNTITGARAVFQVREGGWFLLRAIAEHTNTFRFASTGPFYVQTADHRSRVSAGAARFFLDWVRERKPRVRVDDPGQAREVIKHHEAAEQFWQHRVTMANAP
jgi:hypothetical protein